MGLGISVLSARRSPIFLKSLSLRGVVGAFEVDAEVASADRASADDFEADIDGAVLLEEMAALRLERERIRNE